MLATTQRFCWVFCAALSILPSMAFAESSEFRSEWPMFGQNLQNTASNDTERKISTSNVATLAPKWVAATGGDVSARAAVVDGVVYFPDWGGNVWALDADTGAVRWRHQLTDYGLPAGALSRTSPAVQNGVVYIGTEIVGAYLLAIDAKTGALRWMTQLETNPAAVLTGSPAVFADVVYIGVSGFLEETALAAIPGHVFTFRASVVAVNARTGAILWKTYTTPTGYTGVSVWGSNPVVDTRRKTIFIGTGNNFSTPTDPAYVQCTLAGGTQKFCLSPDDHVDSIVALDMKTGKIKWSQRLSDGDDWNAASVRRGRIVQARAGSITISVPCRTSCPPDCPGPMETRTSWAPDRRAVCTRPSIPTRVTSLGHRARARRDTGRHRVGLGRRRRADLRRHRKFQSPAIRSRHRGLVERARSGHRKNRVADTRSERCDRHRGDDGRKRGRLRTL